MEKAPAKQGAGPMSQDPKPRELSFYYSLAQIGFEMVVPIALGVFLDDWLGLTPWITSVMAVVGFAGGLLHMVLMLNQRDREDSRTKGPP